MKAKTMSLSHIAASGSTANGVRLAKGAIAPSDSHDAPSWMGSFGRLVGRVRRSRSGAAAVEMALVTPVMMGLLFGSFEYGIAFFTYNTMQVAARDIGRQVAINTMLVGGVDAAIRARLPDWARAGATVTVQQSAPANPNTNVYTFVVSMPMSSATPIQFFSLASNPTIRTEVRMKQELPYISNP